MSLRRRLYPLFVALLCAVAAGMAHAQQFPQPTVIPTGNWPVAVYTADINEDGKPDLIYIDYGATPSASTTHILLNNGDGTFRAGVTLATAGAALAIGHFDSSPIDGDPTNTHRDAHVDIGWVTVHGNSISASFAYGNGDGTFVGPVLGNITQVDGSVPNIVSLIAAPYITGQADFLFAVDAANTPGINVFYRLSFYSGTLGPSGAGQLLAANLNGDGLSDFVITAPGKAADVYLSTPPASVPPRFPQSTASYSASGTIASALIADIDGDGIPDLVVEGANGALFYFPGSATGFATTPLSIAGAQDGTTGNGGHLVAIADLNGDHIPDIITSTPAGLSVLLGQPPLNSHTPYSPSYKLLGIYNAGPGHTSYALADFNSDGHLDLAVDSPEGIAILYGKADGSFQTSRSYAAGQPAYSLALGRFTTTGFVDAVVATGIPQFQFLNGNNQGGFSVTTPASPAGSPETNSSRTLWSSVTQGSLYGNSNLGLAVFKNGKLPISAKDGITLHYGNNNGTFSAPVVADPAGTGHYGTGTLTEFNDDGVINILGFDTASCATLSISGSTGTVAGSVLTTNPTHSPYNLVAAGYLKANPGKADVACELNGNIYVYPNNGSGGFSSPTLLPAPAGTAVADSSGNLPATGLSPSALLFVDLDGDGFGDIIALYHNLASDPAHPTTAASNQIDIYWGNGDGTFTAPTILTPSRNFYEANVASVAGTTHPDLILSDGYIVSVLPGNGTARTFGAERHFLAGMGINGILTYPVNAQNAIVVANGGAVFSNPAVNRGTLATNPDVNTGGVTVLTGVATQVTTNLTGALTASPEPSAYNQDFTLTATFTPPAAGGPATGTVTFSFNGTVLGTSRVTNGVATYSIAGSTYAPGTYPISAAYSGDASYDPLTLTLSHVISLEPSQTYLTLFADVIHYGETIGDTAHANAGDLSTPPVSVGAGGTITVFIDGISSCVLDVGPMQTCPASTGARYPVGMHSIYLVYSGNAQFAGSQSINYTVTILPDDTSGIPSSSSNPAVVGTPVTLSAAFTSAIYPPTGNILAPFAIPTGTVTFYDGNTMIGTGMLDATGTATFTTSTLTLGTHPITATLASSLDFNGSTTGILQQQIVQPAVQTATMLASSVNPSIIGQNVTFTAALAFTAMPGGALGGTMTFTIDGSVVATVPLSPTQASASFSISTLALGNHNVVATYSGVTGTFDPSTSNTLVQVVDPLPAAPSFTMTVTPAAISVPIGNVAAVTVIITPLNGFNQPVTLSCGSLPREVLCAFSATTIPTGNGTSILQVTATAPHDCNNSTPYFITPGGSGTWLGVLATSGLAFLIRRRRNLVKAIVLTLALAILPALTGCGHCTDLGVEPGNYTFTVTGTTNSFTVAAPTQVNETVTQTVKMTAHL